MRGDLGNNVLITGANRGLGLAMVGEIASNYEVKRIFAACRDPTKAKVSSEKMNVLVHAMGGIKIEIFEKKSKKLKFLKNKLKFLEN